MERDNLFTMVHKGLRFGFYDLAGRAAATDFTDDTAVGELRDSWTRFAGLLRTHSRQEDRIIHPVAESKRTGAIAGLEAEHVIVRRELDAISAQLERVLAGPDCLDRRRAGSEVTRALHRLLSSALVHFDEEEYLLMPFLWDHCTDDEIASVRHELMTSLTPDEMHQLVDLMLRAVAPAEREQLLARAAS